MDNDDWGRLYRILAATGMEQPVVNHPHPTKGKDAPLPIAWPRIKVGIAFDHTDTPAWEREDWTVTRLSSQLSRTLPDTLRFLDDLQFAHMLRASEAGAEQSVSKTERAVLDLLLRLGVPEPDRNLEIRNDEGRLITVPDFVWTFGTPGIDDGTGLAIFVDGHRYHASKDLIEAISGAGRKKVAVERSKSKAAKDAEVRRWMTARGWTVMVVGDGTVDEGGTALAEAVEDIANTYRRMAQAGDERDVGAGEDLVSGM